MESPASEVSPELAHVRSVWSAMQGNSPIYDFLLADVIIVYARRGLVKAQLKLGPQHVNSRKTIHGAVSAALVDWSGGMSIATHGSQKTGVSVDINISYVGTAVIGDSIEIEAQADRVGSTLAFTSIRISKLVDGVPGPLVATASHTKYVRQP